MVHGPSGKGKIETDGVGGLFRTGTCQGHRVLVCEEVVAVEGVGGFLFELELCPAVFGTGGRSGFFAAEMVAAHGDLRGRRADSGGKDAHDGIQQ